MAKIISVELLAIPEVINVSDNVNDITVVTTIRFHEQDIKQNMEYCLHLFVYDIHGNVDPPLVLPNWDDSSVVSVTFDRKDDFLGQAKVIITPSEEETVIKTPMALHLGKLNKETTYFTRKLEVFATAAPIIGRVSKWSLPFEAKIEH